MNNIKKVEYNKYFTLTLVNIILLSIVYEIYNSINNNGSFIVTDTLFIAATSTMVILPVIVSDKTIYNNLHEKEFRNNIIFIMIFIITIGIVSTYIIIILLNFICIYIPIPFINFVINVFKNIILIISLSVDIQNIFLLFVVFLYYFLYRKINIYIDKYL